MDGYSKTARQLSMALESGPCATHMAHSIAYHYPFRRFRVLIRQNIVSSRSTAYMTIIDRLVDYNNANNEKNWTVINIFPISAAQENFQIREKATARKCNKGGLANLERRIWRIPPLIPQNYHIQRVLPPTTRTDPSGFKAMGYIRLPKNSM